MSWQAPQLFVSWQKPSGQRVGSLHARHPFASATHVLSSPTRQRVSPTVAQTWSQAPQLVASPQKPPGHGVATLQARQPFASAKQALSAPSAHAVAPATEHSLLQRPQLDSSAQKPEGQREGSVHAKQPSALSTQRRSRPPAHSAASVPGQESSQLSGPGFSGSEHAESATIPATTHDQSPARFISPPQIGRAGSASPPAVLLPGLVGSDVDLARDDARVAVEIEREPLRGVAVAVQVERVGAQQADVARVDAA